MRNSLLSIALLSAFSLPAFADDVKVHSHAEEKGVVPPSGNTIDHASSWTATGNIGFVSDYYFRGISQTFHKPAVQGGFDIAHSSGFYAGMWGSNVTPNTYPDANLEVDAYAGYNGTVASVEGLGYTAGLYGYFYPGGSWKDYRASNSGGPEGANTPLTPRGGRWNTYEANFGVSYKWLSAKASVTLGDWFGAERKTGWDSSTNGSTYVEVNAAYPLPVSGLTLIGHVGHLNVTGKLNLGFSEDGINFPSTSISNATSPNYTDWKIGLSKSFAIGKSEGWNAGLYYVESSNDDYWGNRGYGGTSFNKKGTSTKADSKNLNDGRVILTVGRTF